MDYLATYPELAESIDTTDDYRNNYSEFNVGASRFLLITQTSDLDGGQHLFVWNEENWQRVDSDSFIDVTGTERTLILRAVRRACTFSSPTDHTAVANALAASVDNFSSASGPDGGNLACCWAVRRLVHKILGRWITRSDATAIFDVELQQCYGSTWQEADVAAGGIIISPTQGSNIGHVGLLGPGGTGGSRKIYSNSSGAAQWKQNFTLDSWIARYRVQKHLKVRFYPLPSYSADLNA